MDKVNPSLILFRGFMFSDTVFISVPHEVPQALINSSKQSCLTLVEEHSTQVGLCLWHMCTVTWAEVSFSSAPPVDANRGRLVPWASSRMPPSCVCLGGKAGYSVSVLVCNRPQCHYCKNIEFTSYVSEKDQLIVLFSMLL